MPEPLPTSGPISFSEISSYLGLGGTNNSLRSMSLTAGFSTPDSVSEFYGYGGLIEVLWGMDRRESQGACIAPNNIYYADNSSPAAASVVYMDPAGTAPAIPGYYSDGRDTRQWDGTSFVGFAELCF